MHKLDLKKPKERRYSLTSEERDKIAQMKRISDDLKLQHDALQDSMFVELEKVKLRVGLKDEIVSEKLERVVTFDPDKNELVVVDYDKKQVREAREAQEKALASN